MSSEISFRSFGPATIKRIRSSTAQVSFHPIGKALLAGPVDLLPMSPVYFVTHVAGQD
jgi:hypothetical protein